jgi:hypothetical protein
MTASGLIAPTPPVTVSGGAVVREDPHASPAQSSASASRSNISPSVGMSRMQSACSGSITAGSSSGNTSTMLVSLATAATSRVQPLDAGMPVGICFMYATRCPP